MNWNWINVILYNYLNNKDFKRLYPNKKFGGRGYILKYVKNAIGFYRNMYWIVTLTIRANYMVVGSQFENFRVWPGIELRTSESQSKCKNPYTTALIKYTYYVLYLYYAVTFLKIGEVRNEVLEIVNDILNI